jgi:SpoVK/Ycf46/Vps4 family AAA+-type ATPase
MNTQITKSWEVYNQDYLAKLIERIGLMITGDEAIGQFEYPQIDEHQALPAIEALAATFELTDFERDLLLLVAARELNSDIKLLLNDLNLDDNKDYVTFSFAASVLPGVHWDAFAPVAHLRYWHLIELSSSPDLMDSRIKIDERILHYIAGVNYIDVRLKGYFNKLAKAAVIVPSHGALAKSILNQWMNVNDREFLVQLTGKIGNGVHAVCQEVARQAQFSLYVLNAEKIPNALPEREFYLRLYQRESLINDILLMLDVRNIAGNEQLQVAKDFIMQLQKPCVVASTEAINFSSLGCAYYEVKKPEPDEQKSLWDMLLNDSCPDLPDHIDRLVSQFDLGPNEILSASYTAKEKEIDRISSATLWSVCQESTRSNIEGLAQRVEPKSTWQDIVLPDQQIQTLHQIAAHMRQRKKVYDTWGFSDKTSQGLGISALFSGESGTGKTMSAETLANKLDLDLFRVDLSCVVSKYIGETEKNLRRIFDTAEASGAILLFDEADALFGRRSEVKDSHDRYANIEVSYLLQRMEAYRGLAILTTNLKQALDTAFIRRIRFIVHFPYPDPTHREKIWRGIFPKQTPVKDLDMEKLAQMNVAGGNIKNIAMSAAFLAADEDEPVGMKHLFRAAQTECNKLERPLTDSEIQGWV